MVKFHATAFFVQNGYFILKWLKITLKKVVFLSLIGDWSVIDRWLIGMKLDERERERERIALKKMNANVNANADFVHERERERERWKNVID